MINKLAEEWPTSAQSNMSYAIIIVKVLFEPLFHFQISGALCDVSVCTSSHFDDLANNVTYVEAQ